jgi:Phosphotransferase enzyme family
VIAAEGIAHVDVDIARRLLGGVRLRLSPVCGGRNSRVYRVDSSGDGIFALKRYLPLENDGRDRLGVETSALRWMASHGLDMVPRVMAVDVETGSVLLSWMGGSRPNELRPGDVDQVIEFLRVLERLRRTAPLRGARLASEACLSGKELERQIRKRLSDLAALDDEPALRTFLREEFMGVFEIFLDRARRVLLSSELSFEAELRPEKQSLVPSDFGFHNALRDDLGRLAFVDFEYFGWDDPAKLTSDTLLHPGTQMNCKLRSRFRSAVQALYGNDPKFSARWYALYPLFALRWALILLNEFHPERWKRRLLAGGTGSWSDAKRRQLCASRAMLEDCKGIFAWRLW